MSIRVVVVGYGMAGARLAEEIRRHDPDGIWVSVTILGAEPHPAYNRVLLSAVLGGSMSPDAVHLHDADWAGEHRIDLRTGVCVTGIDRTKGRVTVSDGSTVDYDTLVLATGAEPWLPPTEGLVTGDELAPGVVTFRTLEDCQRILEAARPDAPVAVLGGGLLGLEAARGLATRGNPVTVVHPVGHLMERQLDARAGRVLAATLAGLGIDVRLDVVAARYVPGDGLKLADGTAVRADLVVVSAGVRPRTGLAEDVGLDVDGGVLVDDALRTSDPRIRAIGDCVNHPGTVSGLVQPAWEQADVLARMLTGAEPAARYRGTPAVTRLKARDVDLAALGDVHADPDDDQDDSVEVLCLQDITGGRYAKLVIRDERVSGAVLLGLPDAAANITHLFDRGGPVPSDRLGLLLGRALEGATAAASPADLPAAATVCRCNTVSKRQLVSAWRNGARGVADLAASTRATTGCGGCADAVRGIADWLTTTDT